jgi:hypothetical protein
MVVVVRHKYFHSSGAPVFGAPMLYRSRAPLERCATTSDLTARPFSSSETDSAPVSVRKLAYPFTPLHIGHVHVPWEGKQCPINCFPFRATKKQFSIF